MAKPLDQQDGRGFRYEVDLVPQPAVVRIAVVIPVVVAAAMTVAIGPIVVIVAPAMPLMVIVPITVAIAVCDTAEVERIISDAKSYDIDEATARKLVAELLRKGVIYEKEYGHIKTEV